MNPGYAGRTELPDNLKSMFRPISMMVPDSGIIAENILFSDGFQNTKVLAKKVGINERIFNWYDNMVVIQFWHNGVNEICDYNNIIIVKYSNQ